MVNSEAHDASVENELTYNATLRTVDATDGNVLSNGISITRRLKNAFSSMKVNRIIYNFWWEEDCTEILNEVEDDYEEPVILRQEIVRAKEISLEPYCENVEFPWHGHGPNDFLKLNEGLQRLLPIAQLCKTKKDVIRLKRKYKEIYRAYFERPIQIFEENGQCRYSIYNDGRHRIWAAKQANGLLPVWVVQYQILKGIGVERFKKCRSCGEWRFYDNSK